MGLKKYVPLKDRTGRGYCGAAEAGDYSSMGKAWILDRMKAGELPARRVPTGKTFKWVTTYDEIDLLMDSYLRKPSEVNKLAAELTEGL